MGGLMACSPRFMPCLYPALWVGRSSLGPGAGSTPDPNLPSLHDALEEQLGLRLETRRGPIDVLVIDSVHQPTEN
jgi:uncharacterized protein (TIGR03435 family)